MASAVRLARTCIALAVTVLLVFQWSMAVRHLRAVGVDDDRGGGPALQRLPAGASNVAAVAVASGAQPIPRGSGSSSDAFSFTWMNGQPIDGDDVAERAPSGAVAAARSSGDDRVVDVLSIGSRNREELLRTQVSTWASHPSVRYFFGATEDDDAHPDCSSRLTKDAMVQFSANCRGPQTKRKYSHSILKNAIVEYAKGKYLESKSPGWLCAQKRPLHSIGKLIRTYRRSGVELPDWLLLVDDDTYYNMDHFQTLVKSWGEESSFPRVEAGCLVQHGVYRETNFSFPFGGFGLYLSRGSVENLMRPIRCGDNATRTDEFARHACEQVRSNLFGEASSFRDGMSVSDLMHAHASREAFYDADAMTARFPFCFHSDWGVGHYVNHYRVSSHVTNFTQSDPQVMVHYKSLFSAPRYRDKPEHTKVFPTYRIGWTLGLIFGNRPHLEQNCGHDNGRCAKQFPVCHRLSAKQMEDVYGPRSPEKR